MDISIDSAKKISEELNEPEWLRNQRLDAFRESEKLPVPRSRYSKLLGFSVKDFNITLSTADINKGSFMDADFIQVDNQTIKGISEEKNRVIISDLSRAFKNYPHLLEKHLFSKKNSLRHNKFEMLNFSLFSSGLFIYVPEKVESKEPIYANFFLTAPSSAMFVPVVLIADKGSRLKIIQNYKSINNGGASVVSNSVYVFIEEGAHIEYIFLSESGENIYSFTTLRSSLKKSAQLNLRYAWFGARHEKATLTHTMEGEDALIDEVQVFFLDKKEHLDITSELKHNSPRSTSRVLVKGALRDKARAVFQGNVRIEKDAQETDSFLSDHVLLLNQGARADSIPGLEIEANQVHASHSASIGQIDEEQIFYLMSRGLDESEAKKTIVSGFLSPAIDAIPDIEVRERIWKSFESRWER